MTHSRAALDRLSRAARRASLRLGSDRVLARIFLLLPLPLIYAVVGLTVVKVARPAALIEQRLLWGWLVCWLVVVAGAAHAGLGRRPRELGSLALDRYHGLHDRITTALAFSRVPEAERTPMADLAITDALARATKPEPRRAVPLHLPREWSLVLFLLVGLGGIALFEVRTFRELPPPPAPEPLLMSADDIELFRQLADQLKNQTDDPETMAGVRQFNQLLEDLAGRRLDRAEVFRRLGELERKTLRGLEADQESLGEGLKAVARELEKSDLTKRTAVALDQRRLEDAEKAMRELAEKLKRPRQKPSAAELERLREALKRASQANTERQARLHAERQRAEEEHKSLLKKKQAGQASPQDEQKRKEAERKLERLDREKKGAERAARQMSELDRKLAQAAEDLMKELGKGARDLESAAEDLNRMAKNPMSSREKEELVRRLREMKELLRQQGQGGQKRLERLQKFAQRARGQQGQGQGQGQGQSGQRGNKPGPAGSEQGKELMLGTQGGQGEQAIVLGRGMAEGVGAGEQRGKDGTGQPREGAQRGGREWGVGHDENLKGEKSEARGQTKDVTAAGIDTGEGAASSQVIMGAAQRGFVGRGYKRVFTDYETVAEQVMHQDEIPAGYRFYVRRYFQLIRPRD